MSTPKSDTEPGRKMIDDAEVIVLDVSRINAYERNPRRSDNPEYDRIKSSIRNNGLDQPLVITQRPQATDYIVRAGGNTRLKILKELHAETGNPNFARAPCIYTPWRSESEVLLAHLRENDLRGNLTFIDKARAVFEARQLIEQERGVEDMTNKDLAIQLRAAGYSVGESLISQMSYAVRFLLPLIPEALASGMGSPQVVRMRALERAAKTLWETHCADSDVAFDEVFAALCRRYDGAEWDTNALQSAIENEVAEEAEESLHTIRVALDAELKGRSVVVPEFAPIKAPPDPQRQRENNEDAGAQEKSDNADELDASGYEQDEPFAEIEDVQRYSAETPDDFSDDVETGRDKTHALPSDLKSLRGRAWTLASRLAQRNGIGDLVDPLTGKGLGYVLRDVPDPALADQLDEDALAQVCMLWWQLAACAEMTFAPIEAITPTLPSDSVLRRALVDQDAELLFNSIWTLDPGHTGYRLWQSLHDRDWQDLIDLMENYRKIRHLATEDGVKIWGES
jgi:ParB family protein of integrating conjugative element (PFGI_1 class)